jgi:hypothetical protein
LWPKPKSLHQYWDPIDFFTSKTISIGVNYYSIIVQKFIRQYSNLFVIELLSKSKEIFRVFPQRRTPNPWQLDPKLI